MDAPTQHDAVRPAAFRALPPEAPLTMPVQSLHERPGRTGRPTSAPRLIALRRVAVIGGAVGLTAGAGWQMHRVLDIGGPTPLQVVLLVLFVVLFAWIALAATSAVGGAIGMLGGDGRRLGIDPAAPLPALRQRTALLMPTYNEAPGRVMAGVQAMHEALARAGRLEAFDFFVLSDTTDADIWVAEEAAFLAVRARTGDENNLFYRRRPANTERKAGNVADWVRRWGAAYPLMLVLDADSVMSAEAIVALAAAMECHPDVGLIQTLPVIVQGRTLFARMQQFAGRIYGPVVAYGVAWWHGAEGNYWGHNAIIRTAAFAAAAGLPHLRGRSPFGGHILSHDFVEAALLRRAGWAVHMVAGLPGSYEEAPASLADIAVRDRRWCQGNLQHAAVLPARGLHWVSRMHLMMGIGSYVTAPLWLAFLMVGILLSLQARFVRPEYFPAGRSLFPRWPQEDPVRAMWVFVATMAVLLLPKLIGLVAAVASPRMRRGCGGVLGLLASVLVETVLGALVAPVAMLFQTAAVTSILAGRDSGWNPQRRDGGHVRFREIASGYLRHTIFGLVLGAIAYVVSPFLVLWMAPVLLGLIFSVPLASLTGSRRVGAGLRRVGLLRTPEEATPPRVLADAARLRGMLDAPAQEAVARLLADPALLAAHRAMLPPPRRKRLDPIDPTLLTGLARLDEAETLADALVACSPREKAAVLADARGVERLVALGCATVGSETGSLIVGPEGLT